jgi:micrococcal nuclease
MYKKNKQILFLIILIILLFAINYSGINSYFIKEFSNKEYSVVLRVIDGDTVELLDGRHVRMLGINTPEKGEKYYSEAKNYLENLILNNTIELEKTKEDVDLYNRSLRYLFIESKNINLELIKNGLANAYFPSGKDKYSEEFLNAWNLCLQENKNLCEKSTDACANCIELKEFNDENEILIFYNKCSFDCNMNKWTIKDEGRKKFTFENFVLEKNKEIIVKTGKGTNNSTSLYWRNYDYIWTKTGDSLFLRDENEKLVLYSNY